MVDKKESFFSNLFKGKKDPQAEKEKVILQNMIDKKARIISQLQEKLHFEEEKRKRAEVFSKQADIIQRNLESKDKKNRELLGSLETLTLSEKKLTTLLTTLEDKLENTSIEKNNIIKKYDNLIKNLDEVSRENNELKETHKSLKEEIGNLNSLKHQGDQMQIVGDVFLSRDKLEEMQEEISSLKNICGEYRKNIDTSLNDIHLKESHIIDLKERLKNSMSMDKKEVHYKLPTELLFSSSKFSEINSKLHENNLIFIDDLQEDSFKDLVSEYKNYDSAIKLFRDFKEGRYTWDVKTHISKGPKLSKIFSRQRKLLNYFGENYMEFLQDIESFDFDILSGYGFNEDHINSFKEKISEYKKFKI